MTLRAALVLAFVAISLPLVGACGASSAISEPGLCPCIDPFGGRLCERSGIDPVRLRPRGA